MSDRGKELIKLTSTQQERLIELVEKNPILYDLSNKHHRNNDNILDTWKQIAAEMNVMGVNCQYPTFFLIHFVIHFLSYNFID
jgi:hypothetical protein